MSSFLPPSMHVQGFPPGFLAQAEALFGGSLEDAVARLQDGAVPAENVEALRNMFSSLLATAGEGQGPVPDSSPVAASISLPVTLASDEIVTGGDQAGLYAELPADMLAALGLPLPGEILPDDAPLELPPASPNGFGEDLLGDLLVTPTMPGSHPATAPVVEAGSIETSSGALPSAPAVAGVADAADALVTAESADTSRTGPEEALLTTDTTGATGRAISAKETHPHGNAMTGNPAAIVPSMQQGMAADGDVDGQPAEDAPGIGLLTASGASGERAASTDSTPAAQGTSGTSTREVSSSSVSAAAERMAALLAEMESHGGDGNAIDEVQLREAMQRIDTALQAIRGSTAEEAAIPSSPGLEALAARLFAAGEDAEKRAAILQEFRQQLAGGEAAPPAAAPLASNQSAPTATGAERPQQPSLPLGLPLNHERWADEVGERVRWMVGQQMQTAELKITPANLGTIEVRITMHKDQMQISFVSPHAAVREVLEDAAPRLREMMSAAGYSGVDVDVSHHQPQRHGEDGSRHWAAGISAWGEEPGQVEQGAGTIAPRVSGALDCYA